MSLASCGSDTDTRSRASTHRVGWSSPDPIRQSRTGRVTVRRGRADAETGCHPRLRTDWAAAPHSDVADHTCGGVPIAPQGRGRAVPLN